ncbi:MAG: sigma 54-interacting transcriptional regulator, partial [Thermoanaerobaculia bacterium]
VLREAQMACGRYEEAWRGLRALTREAKDQGHPVLLRMALSRSLLLSVLLGRSRAADQARRALQRAPRSGMDLLEAWSDLAVGISELLSGRSSRAALEGARKQFQRLGVASGERAARIALLWEALMEGDRGEVLRGLSRLEAAPPEDHRFLAVARPLVLAEAQAFLGNREGALERLSEASGAIIGSPFLELDWLIEHLRARLALRANDAREARAHLHRAVHARGFLQRLLPADARKRFLAHPRFHRLEALLRRLDRSPRLYSRTPRPGAESFEGMVGRSTGMLQVYRTIEQLRDQEVSVLITGETGTGKELVARALHRTGPRARGPFFALHAGSLPLELLESELFGYEQGAFTGAEAARAGLLESLAGGTLLLDGVDDLAPAAQAKLLRVLDSGRARRLGASEERPVDVRFLSAAAVDLRERVEAAAFRADLLYRLGAVEIRLPPLRERREDIPLLCRHLLELHARRLDRAVPRLEAEALERLESCPWPGNVRQLE